METNSSFLIHRTLITSYIHYFALLIASLCPSKFSIKHPQGSMLGHFLFTMFVIYINEAIGLLVTSEYVIAAL